MVFGGLDGILTSFAILAGAVGAGLGPVALLAMGISNVLADALAMGVGEFLSSRSYNAYVREEMQRETWELENYPEGEVSEMVELFEQQGMEKEDATQVISRMAKYKDFFLAVMMMFELQLPVPSEDDDADSLKQGLIMFVSFASFGMLPIMGYTLVPLFVQGLDQEQLFIVATITTITALFVLGAFKARYGDRRWLRAGIETAVLGGVCAAVAYLVGAWMSSFAASTQLMAYFEQPVADSYDAQLQLLTQQLASANAKIAELQLVQPTHVVA